VNFSPSIYEHCAFLIGRRPWEVSRDEELLFTGQAEGFRRYGQAPVVVGVDLYNLEAEAYGAVVDEPDGNGIPAITSPPFHSLADLCKISPFDPLCAGRIPMVLQVGKRLRDAFPEADVRIPIAGPFSIACNLVGFNLLLCEAVLQPAATRAALEALVEGQVSFCRAVREAGLDIAFFESAAAPPLLSPDVFAQVELPPLKAVISGAAEVMGHPVPCVIGGDTAPILASIMETGTEYVICPASNETDQEAFLQFMTAFPEVMVRINMRPDILSRGDWPAIRQEVDRILALGGGRRQVCLGTGALPYETPPANVDYIQAYLKELAGGQCKTKSI